MNVAIMFKSANFADLSIAPSALYLLASDDTPKPVREQVIERAKSGEKITHKAVKAEVKRVMPKPGAVAGLTV